MKTIRDTWEDYISNIESVVTLTQKERRLLKTAFFAGAMGMLGVITDSLKEGDISKAMSQRLMDVATDVMDLAEGVRNAAHEDY